ncbi:MAG: nucleotide exchange factor GrpE [Bacillota bacterium]|nr:nucleotide exchange factor GrpE [Bacillota bacterium]
MTDKEKDEITDKKEEFMKNVDEFHSYIKKNDSDEETKKEENEELKEANEKYMRLAAEYQNFRKRTETEKQNIAAYANERIAKELLNVVDSFERALSTDNDADESFKNGVELIYKQLMTVLGNFGVEAIETEGKEFDPNFHHAVLSEEAEGTEAGMILMEMQKGYMLKDRVIRPSMVKVSV